MTTDPGSPSLLQNLRNEPYWDPLRNDPGFKALIATGNAR